MFSDPPRIDCIHSFSYKKLLEKNSFFKVKKWKDLAFRLLEIIKLCGFTLPLLMRKTKLMSSAFAFYICPSRIRFAGSKNRQFWVHRAVPLTD